MTYSEIVVTDKASDTETTWDEIIEFENDPTYIMTDASARTIASWYVSTPAMIALSSGQSVRTLRLVYDIGTIMQEFIENPDTYSAGDILHLSALLAWVRSHLSRSRVLS